ncbi:MAG: hypothetical protein IPN42_01640 [Methylococcaceae bacterium]|nr:hypothetical protein [Methylococcaceae bacterium]
MKKTMIIDFTTIPDGTQTKGCLYLDILYLETITGNGSFGNGIVYAGALEVLPRPVQISGPGDYWSHLTGVFVQPVTDVTIVAKTYRNSSCSYVGIDKHGAKFNSSLVIPGIIDGNPPPPDPGWITINLTIPDHSHLVSFHISNKDPKPNDAAFWLKSISFRRDNKFGPIKS